MFEKLKAKLAAKAISSLTSTTMGAVGLILVGATWVQTHPEIVVAVVGAGWGGVVVGAAAVVVALCRLRSL